MSIILKRGLEANRAATAVAEGELLFSKDTGRLYIGSGSGDHGGQEIKFSQLTASSAVVQNVEAISRFLLQAAGGVANANSIYSSRVSSGSLSSPSATVDGQYTAFQMQTFGGSTWSTSARMLMQTAGNHLEDSRPTNIIFATVSSGSSTLSDRFKINGLGVQVTGSFGVTGNANVIGSLTASLMSASIVSASNMYVKTLNVTTAEMSASLFSVDTLITKGGYANRIALITANYTASASDRIIECSSSGDFTVNLFSLSQAISPGQELYVVNAGSGNIIVYPDGTEQISGTPSQTLAPWASLRVVTNHNNTTWLKL